MKLKAPEGVGDPCVAGVIIAPCDGIYDVAPEIGALLIECFGFFEAGTPERPSAARLPAPRRGRSPGKKSAAED